jgi:hypothetical protein
MLNKNILWIYLLFNPLTSFIVYRQQSQLSEVKKWVISENSNLCVNGNTNINTFACEIPAYDQTDTIILSKGRSDKEIVLSGNIGLKVQSFDCHNSIMTRDLRNTLKEKQFPLLHISFLTLSEFPELSAKPKLITGLVNIEIAGTSKRFEVNYQVYRDAQKVINLLGSRDVNFSDFNLVPPRKLGGMIQTRDKLSVAFHLKMTAMN